MGFLTKDLGFCTGQMAEGPGIEPGHEYYPMTD